MCTSFRPSGPTSARSCCYSRIIHFPRIDPNLLGHFTAVSARRVLFLGSSDSLSQRSCSSGFFLSSPLPYSPVPYSPEMLSKVVSGQKPSLKIIPYQGILHFRPQLKYEHLDPTIQHRPDETFWGNVILSLPKPRQFTSLTVKLVAPYVIHMPGHQ